MYGDPAQQQALSMLQFKDFYDPFQQSLFVSDGMVHANNNNNNNNNTTPITPFNAVDPFFGSGGILQNNNEILEESLMNSLTAVATTTPSTPTANSLLTTTKKNNGQQGKMSNNKKRKSQHYDNTSNDMLMMMATTNFNNVSGLWPNYICLYLEYTLPYDPCHPLSHNLSQLPHCYPNCLPTVTVDSISKEKCPSITSLLSSNKNSDDKVLLLAKVIFM
jgi:hypothetical protein